MQWTLREKTLYKGRVGLGSGFGGSQKSSHFSRPRGFKVFEEFFSLNLGLVILEKAGLAG